LVNCEQLLKVVNHFLKNLFQLLIGKLRTAICGATWIF